MKISFHVTSAILLCAVGAGCEDTSFSVRGSSPFGPVQYVHRPSVPSRAPANGGSRAPANDGGQTPAVADNQPPTRAQAIRKILYQIQYRLVPVAGPFLPDTITADLHRLCPDSTEAQCALVRSTLLLLVDEDFLDSTKQQGGGWTTIKARLKAEALRRDPGLANGGCLLPLMDELVTEIYTHPF